MKVSKACRPDKKKAAPSRTPIQRVWDFIQKVSGDGFTGQWNKAKFRLKEYKRVEERKDVDTAVKFFLRMEKHLKWKVMMASFTNERPKLLQDLKASTSEAALHRCLQDISSFVRPEYKVTDRSTDSS